MPVNPFTYGNPISDPGRFFGRSREVEQIIGRLRNEEFESSSLVGDRRIGKTSLLNYLSDPTVRAAHHLGPDEYIFVYADLQMVDEAMGPDQLWRRLLTLMRRRCEDEAVAKLVESVKDERLDTFVLDELFDQIDDKGQHVVFLMDEFEHVTTNENFDADFYYGLRSLVIHHQLAIVTSSRRELIELCHSDAIKSSPFFNIFANINLRLFSPADAEHMMSQSLAGTGVQFSEPETARVLDLAGFHPYFLQAACWMLFESYLNGLAGEARMSLLWGQFGQEAAPHFTDYWDNSDDYEKIVLTAGALLERANPPGRDFSMAQLHTLFARSEPTVKHLEKRGLLMPDAGHSSQYRLFSSALRPWILDQITASLGEEQSYESWMTANQKALDRISGKQGVQLREILPKVGPNYRQLIITWASDPRTLAAVASLLKIALTFVN
jgi:AAA-like domain